VTPLVRELRRRWARWDIAVVIDAARSWEGVRS
jgi:hypothetical protein